MNLSSVGISDFGISETASLVSDSIVVVATAGKTAAVIGKSYAATINP